MQRLVQNSDMGDRHTAITHLNFLTSKGIEEYEDGERFSRFLQMLEIKVLWLEEYTNHRGISSHGQLAPSCRCAGSAPVFYLPVREVASASEGLPVLGDGRHQSRAC